MDITVTDLLKRAQAEAQEATAAREAAQARAAAAVADANAAVAHEEATHKTVAWIQQQTTEPAAPVERTEQADRVPAPTATRFGRPVPEVPQTELCRRVLEDLGRPASTREIRDRLARDGHELSQSQVRSTLKYMARKPSFGVETETGSGVWRLQRSSAAAPFQGDGAVTGIPVLNGAGRGS
jgi:hypothetical protein